MDGRRGRATNGLSVRKWSRIGLKPLEHDRFMKKLTLFWTPVETGFLTLTWSEKLPNGQKN